MLSLLRRLRIMYSLYNFFHKKQLIHNLPHYKKYGINKSYYSSVSSKDFRNIQLPHNDKPALGQLEKEDFFKQLSVSDQESLIHFEENGYAILRNFFSEEKVNAANKKIDAMVQSGEVKFKYGNKIMFAFKKAEEIKSMGVDSTLIQILSALINTKALLFQSINFLKGSEQETHSDSIHMTTFPLGKLIAVWVALEDIDATNGPLHYYPGSHKLPYYMNADYDNEGNQFMIGDKSYEAYEEMIRKKIEENKLSKQTFTAKKGDILIWHANLFHGGEKHMDKNRTRKSVVFHYFGEDAICYHEITQRPALMHVGSD